MWFEKILFSAVCISGLVLFINRFILGKRYDKKNPPVEAWHVDYSRALFPTLLFVFILRSFVVEPYRIPSSSMMPTLEIGDFLLVSKSSYGVKLPIIGKKIISVNDPERGDVFVFKYPLDNNQNYIKRVLGLPGDKITYQDKRLFINDKEVQVKGVGEYKFLDGRMNENVTNQFVATLDNGLQHDLLLNPLRSSGSAEWVVPEGNYFAIGDNRDHSADSRYWGFVPEENIVGKAFFIWFHYDGVTKRGFDFSRVGHSIYK